MLFSVVGVSPEKLYFVPTHEKALKHLRGADRIVDQYQSKGLLRQVLTSMDFTVLMPKLIVGQSNSKSLSFPKCGIRVQTYYREINSISPLGISLNSEFWLFICLISKLPTSASVTEICYHAKIVQILLLRNMVLFFSLFWDICPGQKRLHHTIKHARTPYSYF